MSTLPIPLQTKHIKTPNHRWIFLLVQSQWCLFTSYFWFRLLWWHSLAAGDESDSDEDDVEGNPESHHQVPVLTHHLQPKEYWILQKNDSFTASSLEEKSRNVTWGLRRYCFGPRRWRYVAFDSGVDSRAIASADADEDIETLLQKIQTLIDELQEVETFLSSSEGMSARKEDINKRDNDLTMRMKVKRRISFCLLFFRAEYTRHRLLWIPRFSRLIIAHTQIFRHFVFQLKFSFVA